MPGETNPDRGEHVDKADETAPALPRETSNALREGLDKVADALSEGLERNAVREGLDKARDALREGLDKATPLEQVVADAIDNGEVANAGVLGAALGRRLELLDGAHPDKAVRAGAAVGRLANFARLFGEAEQLPVMDVGAMREILAAELAYALAGGGGYADLDVIENAKVIRDLTEAYVRLGGELGLLMPSRGEALPAIRDNDAIVRGVWQRLNAEKFFTTTELDEIAGAVRAELEAGE